MPKGSQWASRPEAHRWLGTWRESGVLDKVLTALQEMASITKMINFERLAIDGFFSAGKGGGEEIEYGINVIPVAFENGHLNVVQLLLLGISEIYRGQVLDWAARYRHSEIVRLLLDFGVSEEAKEKVKIWATIYGYSEIVQLLASGISKEA